MIEKLSRGVVVRRRLPKRYGANPIYVTPDVGLRFWLFNADKWDQTLFQMCDEFVHPGSVVWDVGANVGLFTFAAAAKSGKEGRVVAIEPDIFLANLLQKTILATDKLGKDSQARIDILPLAISQQVASLEFNIAKSSRSRNFISGLSSQPSNCGGARESKIVMGVTLDWLLDYFPAPQVVKIDVERAEVQVLKGAFTLLEKIRPIIIIECEVLPEFKKSVGDILNQFNYKIYNAEVPANDRVQLDLPTWNNIALPQ